MKIRPILLLTGIVSLSLNLSAQRKIRIQLVDSESQLPVREAAFRAGEKTFSEPPDRDGYFNLSVNTTDTLVIESPLHSIKKVALPGEDTFVVTLDKTADSGIFVVVDETATFPGGMWEFYRYVAESITYPSKARKANAEGKVFVEFVIDQDGTIDKQSVRVIKGIHPACDAEAVRIIQGSPAWIPGKIFGRPVRQKFVLPVAFRQEGKKRR